MAGKTRRRGAAATGLVMAAAVLAMPSLAGAQEHGHESTSTTIGSTTSTTTSTTSTTTSTSTTTTTRYVPPPPPEVYEVVTPGSAVTRSGGGCLFDGKPGELLSSVANAAGQTNVQWHGPARPDGTWTVTYTVPGNFSDGVGAGVVGCVGETAEPRIVDTYYFIVETPGTPPYRGNPGSEGRAAIKAAETKANAPKSVKTSPKYTG